MLVEHDNLEPQVFRKKLVVLPHALMEYRENVKGRRSRKTKTRRNTEFLSLFLPSEMLQSFWQTIILHGVLFMFNHYV